MAFIPPKSHWSLIRLHFFLLTCGMRFVVYQFPSEKWQSRWYVVLSYFIASHKELVKIPKSFLTHSQLSFPKSFPRKLFHINLLIPFQAPQPPRLALSYPKKNIASVHQRPSDSNKPVGQPQKPSLQKNHSILGRTTGFGVFIEHKRQNV